MWLLGYPNQAAQQLVEALVLAQELAHPLSLALTQGIGAIFHIFRRDVQTSQVLAEACLSLSGEHGFLPWLGIGTFCRGWALVEQGQVTERINQMRQGIETWRATGSVTEQPLQLALLGQAYGQIGMLDEGLALLAEALAIVQRNEERFYEAETTSASKSAMIEGL